MIQQTSLAAFRGIENKIQDKERQVLTVLSKGSFTNNEIALALALGWTINSVTGRITRLQNLGIVESVGKKPNPDSGYSCNVWGIRVILNEEF